MAHRRRATDTSFIHRWWVEGSPWVHIVTIIFIAGSAWATFNGLITRVDALEIESKNATYSLSALTQEVHDIHEWVRVK